MTAIRTPWMSDEEIRLIESHLQPDMDLVEYGAGYSTLYWAKKVKTLLSIEHNSMWAQHIKGQLESNNVQNVKLRCVPPEPPVKSIRIGPYQPKYLDAFKAYALAGTYRQADAAIIDGRARVLCARLVLGILPIGGKIFFHDYFAPGRKRYHEFFESGENTSAVMIDQVKTGQTLAVFEKAKS